MSKKKTKNRVNFDRGVIISWITACHRLGFCDFATRWLDSQSSIRRAWEKTKKPHWILTALLIEAFDKPGRAKVIATKAFEIILKVIDDERRIFDSDTLPFWFQELIDVYEFKDTFETMVSSIDDDFIALCRVIDEIELLFSSEKVISPHLMDELQSYVERLVINEAFFCDSKFATRLAQEFRAKFVLPSTVIFKRVASRYFDIKLSNFHYKGL